MACPKSAQTKKERYKSEGKYQGCSHQILNGLVTSMLILSMQQLGGSGGMLSSKFLQFKCSEIVSEAIFRPRQWPDDRSPYQHEYLLRCPLHLMVLVSASQSITWRIESSWSSRRLGRDSFTLLSYSLASTCCISPANVHSICVWTSRGRPPSHDTLATLSKPKVRETGIHQVPRVLYMH